MSPVFPHIPLKWGDPIDEITENFDIIIGSDLMLYKAQYKNLLKTIKDFLCRNPSKNRAIISWGRKITKESEQNFFQIASELDLLHDHIIKKIFRFRMDESKINQESNLNNTAENGKSEMQ